MMDSKWSCGCNTHRVGKALLVVGGLNWGLVGLGMLMGKMESWNVVAMILGSMPTLEAIVYVLVGVAAVMNVFGCKCNKCMSCKDGSCNHGDM